MLHKSDRSCCTGGGTGTEQGKGVKILLRMGVELFLLTQSVSYSSDSWARRTNACMHVEAVDQWREYRFKWQFDDD